MSVGEYEAARKVAFTFFSVDDMSMAHIERILNVPRQFVKSVIAHYESGQRDQKKSLRTYSRDLGGSEVENLHRRDWKSNWR